jgi:hypothetical protein
MTFVVQTCYLVGAGRRSAWPVAQYHNSICGDGDEEAPQQAPRDVSFGINNNPY